MKTHYDILNISVDASTEEIIAACEARVKEDVQNK
jgi:hypothetical protein